MDNFRCTSKRSERLSQNFEFSNSCILERFAHKFPNFQIWRIFRWTFRNSWEITMGWILCDGRREAQIILSGIFDWLWSWESFKAIQVKNSQIFTIFFFSNLLKSHFSLIKCIKWKSTWNSILLQFVWLFGAYNRTQISSKNNKWWLSHSIPTIFHIDFDTGFSQWNSHNLSKQVHYAFNFQRLISRFKFSIFNVKISKEKINNQNMGGFEIWKICSKSTHVFGFEIKLDLSFYRVVVSRGSRIMSRCAAFMVI